jgi:hypothetical protein
MRLFLLAVSFAIYIPSVGYMKNLSRRTNSRQSHRSRIPSQSLCSLGPRLIRRAVGPNDRRLVAELAVAH